MIRRIARVEPLPDYKLSVVFDDGKHVVYDVRGDFALPGYSAIKEERLFQTVQLDESRTCVSWSNDIDLPSDVIYEYGEEC